MAETSSCAAAIFGVGSGSSNARMRIGVRRTTGSATYAKLETTSRIPMGTATARGTASAAGSRLVARLAPPSSSSPSQNVVPYAKTMRESSAALTPQRV
jgi:hypothetical protein